MTHMVDESNTSVDEYTLYAVVTQKSTASPLCTPFLVNSHPVDMEVDTGAAFSLISEATFNKLGVRILHHHFSPQDSLFHYICTWGSRFECWALSW